RCTNWRNERCRTGRRPRDAGRRAAAPPRRESASPWRDNTPMSETIGFIGQFRSEEHTSELQSLTNLLFPLLLSKQKHHPTPRHHLSPSLVCLLLLPPPPRSTLFPYTTLFRSALHELAK